MPGSVLHTQSDANPVHKSAAPAAKSVTDATSLAAALQEQEWDAISSDANELDLTLYSFLDSLPGIACQIRLDKQGALHLPYVSEGCFDLLGISALQLQQHPQVLISCLHPEDADSFHQSMQQSAAHLTPWNWEGRIVLPVNGEIKWLNLRAKHHETNSHGTVWKGFVVNVTQNKQAEIELKDSRQRLSELSSHIESIKEEERTRIAREIHDEIGALLTALKMDLAWLERRLPTENSAILEKTQDMANLLNTAGKAANELVHSLRPGALDCFGIVAAIEIEAAEFSKRTGTRCNIIKSNDNIDVPNEHSITLFRIFQETLNNITKHADAKQVEVKIHKTAANSGENAIELIVSDDGCGLDERAYDKPRSFGLRGIRERARQLDGEVTIASEPGKGTTISVRLPLPANS
jgi:two-component system sensor histidine kinase UhpB